MTLIQREFQNLSNCIFIIKKKEEWYYPKQNSVCRKHENNSNSILVDEEISRSDRFDREAVNQSEDTVNAA